MSVIHIKIFAYGRVKNYLDKRFNRIINLSTESSVEDLFKLLNKPAKEVWLVNVNGLLVNQDYKLQNNDVVKLFEPVGGG